MVIAQKWLACALQASAGFQHLAAFLCAKLSMQGPTGLYLHTTVPCTRRMTAVSAIQPQMSRIISKLVGLGWLKIQAMPPELVVSDSVSCLGEGPAVWAALRGSRYEYTLACRVCVCV